MMSKKKSNNQKNQNSEEETEVWGFGSNSCFQLGYFEEECALPARLTSFSVANKISKIACGNSYTMVLSSNGKLYGVGRNNYYQIGAPETETYAHLQLVESLKDIHIVDVACGDEHTVCVSSDHKVYGFGKNSHYQLGNTKGLSQQPHRIASLENFKIKKVECGSRFTIVLTDDGKLYGFGQNSNYEISYSEPTQQHFPRLIQQLKDVSIESFSCGSSHTMVIDSNGVLYGFGSNESGQLGLGKEKFKSEPTIIHSLKHVRISKVVCGSYFTMACSETGTVYAFGQNTNGQLGLKISESVNTPTTVPLDADVVDIACGFGHAIFLSDEGKVYMDISNEML